MSLLLLRKIVVEGTLENVSLGEECLTQMFMSLTWALMHAINERDELKAVSSIENFLYLL